MKHCSIAVAVMILGTVQQAVSQDISSEYTHLDRQADCAVISASDGEGVWADYVCSGWRGYPLFLRYTDGRETITYGYMTDQGMPSIMPFNEASGTVEWRLIGDGVTRYPFAAIHRWSLSVPGDGPRDEPRELLVVSKVGQPLEHEACALAFLVASQNPQANQQARDIADEHARAFVCGSDPVILDPGLDMIVSQQR